MLANAKNSPNGALAFELNVLGRLKFANVAMPLAQSPALGAYLKRSGVTVAANDTLRSSAARGTARIVNCDRRLSADDIAIVLDDAYVPGYKLENPSLTNWFSESDAWWFDNVRRNVDRLDSPVASAIAASLAIDAGRYVMSFTDETRQFRQPLSVVYRRLWSVEPEPYNNGGGNLFHNTSAENFLVDPQVIENFGDLMFLRMPDAHVKATRESLGTGAWAEEWLRGGNSFWDELESSQQGRFGSATPTKSQYLKMLENLLEQASNSKTWAIALMESGFVATQDIVDCIAKYRRVDCIYTKDFYELTGTKAVVITA